GPGGGDLDGVDALDDAVVGEEIGARLGAVPAHVYIDVEARELEAFEGGGAEGDHAGVVRLLRVAEGDAGGSAHEGDVGVGEVEDADAGAVGHDGAVGVAVAGVKLVAPAVGVRGRAAAGGAVVGAADVVAGFVGEHEV